MAKPKNTFRVRQKIADSKRGPQPRDTGIHGGSCVGCGDDLEPQNGSDFCEDCLKNILDD